MKRPTRVALRIVSGAAVLVAALAVAAAAFLALTLPKTRGSARIAGLSEPATVWRDLWGVPTVRAASAADAMRALGYLHASDRLWQMELRRRAAFGRLSEIFGAATVETDFRMRANDLERLVREDLAALDGETRGLLEAYSEGVNALISSRRNRPPPEFLLLRHRPEPWRAEDSLAFARLMLLGLSASDRFEMRRYENFRRFGALRALELMRLEPGATDRAFLPPGIDEYSSETLGAPGAARHPGAGAAAGETDAFSRVGGGGAGSNSWAVSGARTARGAPILANDPHLEVEQPGTWYEAGLIAPGLEVRGLTLAGVPGVVIGRNRHVAWGVTVNQADDQDLFIERVDGSEPPRYLQDGLWSDCLGREETVRVRGAAPVTRTLLSTPRGPLLPPEGGRPWMSIRVAALEAAGPLPVFWRIARARGAGELLEALRGYEGTALNVTYADDAGRYGFKTAGSVPVRTAGDGRLPAPGWSGAYGWGGTMRFEDLPGLDGAALPPDGFVVTANNDLLEAGGGEGYPGDWAPPFRAARIAALLEARTDWTIETMRDVQSDVVSGLGLRLVAAVERLGRDGGHPTDGEALRALEVLRGWDGSMSRSGPARLAGETIRALARGIFEDEMRAAGSGSLPGGPHSVMRLLEGAIEAAPGSEAWLDDLATTEKDAPAAVAAAALASAWSRLASSEGEDPAGWSWAEAHRVEFRHPLGRAARLSRWLDLGPVGLPGDGETVSVAAYSLREPFRVVHIPTARLLFDLSDPDRGLAVLPTGQSGHPLSRHYRDQLPLWSSGGYRPAPLTEPAARAAARSTLTLRP